MEEIYNANLEYLKNMDISVYDTVTNLTNRNTYIEISQNGDSDTRWVNTAH